MRDLAVIALAKLTGSDPEESYLTEYYMTFSMSTDKVGEIKSGMAGGPNGFYYFEDQAAREKGFAKWRK